MTQAKTKETKEIQLKRGHKLSLDLLVEKENNLAAALGEQKAEFCRWVEEDFGLETGALGTQSATYQIDAERGVLVPKPEEDA